MSNIQNAKQKFALKQKEIIVIALGGGVVIGVVLTKKFGIKPPLSKTAVLNEWLNEMSSLGYSTLLLNPLQDELYKNALNSVKL